MAQAGPIHEDESRGTRRERWWARPESQVLVVPGTDVEGRAIDDRMLAMFFARDEDVRHGHLIDRPSPAWQKASFVGNWFVPLTLREADELGRALFALVDEVRRRPRPRSGTDTLVSLSVLPLRSRSRTAGACQPFVPRSGIRCVWAAADALACDRCRSVEGEVRGRGGGAASLAGRVWTAAW